MGLHVRIKKCFPVKNLYMLLLAACAACAVLAACLFWQQCGSGSAGGRGGNVTVDSSAADAGSMDSGSNTVLSDRKVYFSGFDMS